MDLVGEAAPPGGVADGLPTVSVDLIVEARVASEVVGGVLWLQANCGCCCYP
jgi:hypothetical protein